MIQKCDGQNGIQEGAIKYISLIFIGGNKIINNNNNNKYFLFVEHHESRIYICSDD